MDCNLYIYRVTTPEPVKITNYRPLSINHACLSLMPHVWAWDARTVGLAIDGSVPQPMERSRKKLGLLGKLDRQFFRLCSGMLFGCTHNLLEQSPACIQLAWEITR